jgi:hypothetical protein
MFLFLRHRRRRRHRHRRHRHRRYFLSSFITDFYSRHLSFGMS